MLTVKELCVRYPQAKQLALDRVTNTFEKGEFICVLGKSGAGKSTFIRCLNGLQLPTSGQVIWNQKNLSTLAEPQLREIRSDTGMIFQHFNLIPRLSVFQNVLTGLFGRRRPLKNFLGLFSEAEKNKAWKVLEDVELTEHAHRRVEALSGGQKQRVGIARALIQEPQVFLGDEPVASLDPATAEKIFTILQSVHQEHGLLTIINVHDVWLAKRFATRIIALDEGTLMFDGTPEQLTEKMYGKIYKTNTNPKREYVSI